MPSATSRPAPARAGARHSGRRTVSRSTSRRANSADLALHIRWDRVARTALLFVLLGVLALYVQPARNYLSTWNTASDSRAKLQSLQREHKALLAQRKSLRDPRTLEHSARRLGMVRPTERSYVVRGLPR
jgi:cell division protein FtsB